MPMITVTETFNKSYELEVADLNTDTIRLAIDNYIADEGDEPQWIGTEAFDTDGNEILSF